MSNNDNKFVNQLETAASVISAGAAVATALVGLFTQLAESGNKLNGISMPNIPFPTMGGHVFWDDLAKVKGWRLQKNMVTGHCRILDPDDVRRAWGGESALLKMLQDLSRS